MNTALTATVSFGLLIAIGIMAAPMIFRKIQASNPRAVETASADAADQLARDKVQTRVNAMAADGCQSRAQAITVLFF